MVEKEYEIKHLNKKYFQKSTFFLYPLLKIPKTVVPMETYLHWDDYYSLENMVLICKFKKFTSKKELEAEASSLIGHPLYIDYYELEDGNVCYVFTMSSLKKILDLFIDGKYSKFSTSIKERILSYYKAGSYTGGFLKSYLYPDDYYELYSKLLNININVLKETGELIDMPDLEKEKLKLKAKTVNITTIKES